jgi:hypothetical protein
MQLREVRARRVAPREAPHAAGRTGACPRTPGPLPPAAPPRAARRSALSAQSICHSLPCISAFRCVFESVSRSCSPPSSCNLEALCLLYGRQVRLLLIPRRCVDEVVEQNSHAHLRGRRTGTGRECDKDGGGWSRGVRRVKEVTQPHYSTHFLAALS